MVCCSPHIGQGIAFRYRNSWVQYSVSYFSGLRKFFSGSPAIELGPTVFGIGGVLLSMVA